MVLCTPLCYLSQDLKKQAASSRTAEVLAKIVPGQEERVMSIAAEQWKAEAKAEGRAQGRAEAEAKGKAESLLRLLDRRFGPIPESLRSQVNGANLELLDLWFDRALDASALDAVFGDAKH
jgi:flagellar biosynthesis/type III secretory pathway protein FliH